MTSKLTMLEVTAMFMRSFKRPLFSGFCPVESCNMASMNIPHLMRAVVTTAPKTISVQQIAVPVLSPGDVLIKVAAAALNPTDWKHAEAPKMIPGNIAGCDFAGTVVKVADGVTIVKEGDRVSAFEHGSMFTDRGAFSEYAKAQADLVFKIPDGVSFEDASTMNSGLWTAIQALFNPTRLNLAYPNETMPAPWVFIYAGSTSVGMFAIQLAHRAGYRVATTCSSHNFELVKLLGADVVFDYKSEGWPEQVKKATEGTLAKGLDTISQEATLKASAAAFGPDGGKLVCLIVPPASLKEGAGNVKIQHTLIYTALGRSVDDTVTVSYNASPEDRAHMVGWMSKITDLLMDGSLKAIPVKLWPGGLEGVPGAYQYMKEGKISAEKIVFAL